MLSCYNPSMIQSPSPGLAATQSSTMPLYRDPWFYALLAGFLLLVLFCARLNNDYDFGFHLKGGQWILENHAFPTKDTYTYTVNNHDYLDIHWLYQVTLYSLYRLGGYSLISIANIALILLIFIILMKRLGLTRAPFWLLVLLFGIAVLGCELRFRVRPEYLSWLFMSLDLWILEKWNQHRKGPIFLLPLIQLAWVNIEGLFGIGCGLTGFYLLSGLIHSRRLDKKLLRYFILTLAACLVNPHFIRGALYPLQHLAMLGSPNVFKETINELQSPWTLAGRFSFLPEWTLYTYKLFCLLLLVLFAAAWKKRRAVDYLLAGCFFIFSASAQRNIPLFMLVSVPLAASCWKDLAWKWPKKIHMAFTSRPWAGWAFTVFLLGIGMRVFTNAYYVSERRADRFGLGLDEAKLPVRAARFLVENRLDGRILNQMNLGGWLDWQAPQKVFLDGRLEVMGEELFSDYFSSMKPGGLEPLTEKYGVEIMFFNPDTAFQWLLELKNMPDWRAVYLDDSTVIYLKKGYAPKVPDLDDGQVFTKWGISPSILKDAPTLLQAPRPSSRECFWEDFYRPTDYPMGLHPIDAYYSYTGRFDLAEAVHLENIRRSRGRYYDLFFNLGSMYFHAGKYEQAKICMGRVLGEVPGLPAAQKILDSLPTP